MVRPPTPLMVDVDGNGTNDITLRPHAGSTTYPDRTPPEALFAFDLVTKDFAVRGVDGEGSTTVRMSTSSIIIADQNGNTLVIPFVKFKEKPTKLRVVFDRLIYNDILRTIPKVTLEYDWDFKKNGTLKSLSQDLRIRGVRRITTEYSANTGLTKIVDRVREDGEKSVIKSIKTGLIVLTASTQEGVLGVVY